ncbi:GTP-binding protein [Thermogymnomonas acidicola]|uniref:GTP-binding protein n=1 Tax=Thermogymnomonas acidicola TaxID=399579 RepID=A0AA37BPV9_9ARCH|nr:GTP-binding protein [Thermogymnomonas acidicola]GGM67904.1 GTP-binding protein [Thermogymnomonas acidicola]
MGSIEDRIREIEEELRRTEYNKATEKHIGLLKAKLARLQMEAESHRKGGGTGFAIPKSGDATVALVGFPNVGKSTLLNRLTNSRSETGNFAFTTLRVVPGTLEYKGARIQILDLPGIIENASRGAGRGREVLSMVRNADLVLLVTDTSVEGLDKIRSELYSAGIVLDRERKNISVKKTNSGGIRIHRPRKLSMSDEDIRDILKEFRIVNAEVFLREDITQDDLVEYLRGNAVYVPSLTVVNKVDMPHSREELMERLRGVKNYVLVSAASGLGIEELKERIFSSLSLVRIYLRDKSGRIDYERPLVLRKGVRIEDVCRHISREMLSSFRYAIVSGPSRRIGEQRVGLDHEVYDGDVVTIISRN